MPNHKHQHTGRPRRVVPHEFMNIGQCPQNCAFDNCFDLSKTTRSGGNENLTQPCTCNFGQRSPWDMAMYMRYYEGQNSLTDQNTVDTHQH